MFLTLCQASNPPRAAAFLSAISLAESLVGVFSAATADTAKAAERPGAEVFSNINYPHFNFCYGRFERRLRSARFIRHMPGVILMCSVRLVLFSCRDLTLGITNHRKEKTHGF